MSVKKNYYRIMLGRGSMYAEEGQQESFIGADFGIDVDLTEKLPDNWRTFNKKFIPVFLEKKTGKSKVVAGLACGALHTIAKGIQKGDIVLSPNGRGSYLVGEVETDYTYHKRKVLPHRRGVRWHSETIERTDMSEALKRATGSAGTVSNVSQYWEEIENLITGNTPPPLIATDESIEDPSTFVLEKHLEDFLIQNWRHTSFGEKYNIFEEDGDLVGQQFPTDTGRIDIFAISKDEKELLIVELKKGRASDAVVGQIQRYMGYVLGELAEENQKVRGIIIALEKDLRLERALQVTHNIEFYQYKVNFDLIKG